MRFSQHERITVRAGGITKESARLGILSSPSTLNPWQPHPQQITTGDTDNVETNKLEGQRIEDTDFSAASSEQAKNEMLLQSAIISRKSDDEHKGLLFKKLV